MSIFLYNGNREYSYEMLIDSINQQREYCRLFKSEDLYAYFENFIKAIAANKSLTLLDSDLNISEIEDLNEESVNFPEELDKTEYAEIDELIAAIQNSTSEITIFTSGTTGQPKKVIHSISTLTRAVRVSDNHNGDIWAYAYNPTHMAGLQVFFQAFINKNTLVNVFNLQRNEVYSIISKYKITHISATPTFYRLLLPYEQEYPLVRRVTLGGEKSSSQLYENIGLIFPNAKINNVYASTEAGSLFAAKGDCFQLPVNMRDKFIVVDEELLIHCSLLGRSDSYKLDGEYYHSGDLIEWVDEEKGCFRFKSRKNELINVGGYKVNPSEVEEAIDDIDGVRQSLVYGKPNSVLGNIVVAEVLRNEDSEITDMEIRKLLRIKLQDFKIPRKIIFVEEFTLTRTGKIKRL